MKKIVSTFLVITCMLTRLWGQGSGPYAAFGCEGTVLDVPAASDGIFEYANADTSSECRRVLLDTRLHIVAFLDKNDSVLHTAAVRREMMLRWFAPDPANQYWSGYVAMGNNPVSMVDPDGRQTNGESTQNKNVVSRTDQLWGTEKAGKGMTGSEQISLGYRNYGGDYSGSFMDYTYLVADAINSINPAAAWMDYGAYLLYRTDRFGNPMSTVQATIVGASIFIPVSRGISTLNSGINITEKGLAHTLERHTVNDIAKFAGKSKFFNTTDVPGLIRQATQQPILKQANGNFARIVNAGRDIGIDRATGQATSIYTVITGVNGNLITAFPGMP